MENTQCLVIGGGPAGLSAAIYTARAGLDTLVLGCDPKVAGDYDIDNYFGFEQAITGRELIERGRRQAQRFGAKLRCEKVLSVHHAKDGPGFDAKSESDSYKACIVILATGANRMRPKIPGLADFEGKGVSYCVSCDGFFFKNKPVLVAGEGLFAANQALELLNYTPDIMICTLGKEPSIPQEYRERLQANSIEVCTESITALSGQMGLETVHLSSGRQMQARGLFVALGEASSTDFAYTLGVTRKGNFIEVDPEMKTNIPGVFAAGDCTGGFLQVAVAVGEGALAAKAAISYIKEKCPRQPGQKKNP